MEIVYCSDANYLPLTELSIRSVKKYNSDAHVTVVSLEPLPGSYYTEYDRVVIPVNHEFRFRGPNDHITKTAYLRLYLTQLPYDKIIYMDGDMICQRPLKSLWEMPCDFINCCESHSYGKVQAQGLGLKRYACSGMLVMNLKALREWDFCNKCLEIEKLDIPTEQWRHDETMLNLACKGKLNFINQTYNYCKDRQYDNPINEGSAHILHYIGGTQHKQEMIERPTYQSIPMIMNLIHNKNVAIVGNAKSIFDKQYGPNIDSHDVVIRFNKGFIVNRSAQGIKTDILMLACELTPTQINSYEATYVLTRSGFYNNPNSLVLPNRERKPLSDMIGKQPSTGFMAIDLCLTAGAKSIDLYGFDFEKTPTFYNPEGYVTQHDYSTEESFVSEYIDAGLLTLNS